MGVRVVAADDGRSCQLRICYGIISRMGLQTEHVLGLGTAVGIDSYLRIIASALPAS